MTTNDAPPEARLAPERRWPMATAVLVAIVLQVITPHTGRLRFWWVFPVLEVAALVAVIASMGGTASAEPKPRSTWAHPARAMRPVHRPGPGAWRASGLPD